MEHWKLLDASMVVELTGTHAQHVLFFCYCRQPKAIHTEKRDDLAPEQQANRELSMMTVLAVILGYLSDNNGR